MNVSVALCTYNGEKYVEEQLHSILNQTLPVDEIVVCDDGSSDNTISIIQQISLEKPGIIRLKQNKKRLGVYVNFMNVLSFCRGDIIFLSDQDDVWYKDKVERQVAFLHKHPNIELVFSDATLMGGSHNGELMSDNLNFPKENRKMFSAGLAFELSLFQVYALGASVAVRKRLVDSVLEAGPLINSHDHCLQLEASAQDAIAYLNTPLYLYRMHEKQASNAETQMERIKDSIVFPTNGEVWPLKELESKLKDSRQIARSRYMTERNRLLHNSFAPIIILMRLLKYIRLYHNSAPKVMRYDISRSTHFLIRRICKRIKK